MSKGRPNHVADPRTPDPRWKDMYRVGAISCITGATLIVLAIGAFFIWPFAAGTASTADILTALHEDRLGGLMSLDLMMVVINLISVLPLLAVYVALKPVNESWALIALVLGLIAVVSVIPTRPLAELAYLGDRYAAAMTDAARNQYLAAGETLLTLLSGTAWMIFTVLISLSSLISSLIMLRSPAFSKAAGYVGVIGSLPGFFFFIPVVGPILLFVATIGGVIWYVLIARTFYRLGWARQGS